MNTEELEIQFDELFMMPSETEWVEFKTAKNAIHFNELGKYFSALSNEANLKRQQWGWLILGVQESPRMVIGTIGSGIKRIFRTQRDRFFPMPDYDFSDPYRVKARLFGTILDEKYTRLMTRKTDLDLWDVIALDKVQKNQVLSEAEFQSLKSQKLVEGRRPNLHVSSDIAATTRTKAADIRQRAFDKNHYKKMVLTYLDKLGRATREDFDELLLDKLSDILTKKQKKTFVTNLLQEMRREDRSIVSIGATRSARWILHNSNPAIEF